MVGNSFCSRQCVDVACCDLWWIINRVQMLGLEYRKWARKDIKSNSDKEERLQRGMFTLLTHF